MKEKILTIHRNGISTRYHNRRVIITKEDDKNSIEWIIVDGICIERAMYMPLRNCGSATKLLFTDEAIEMLYATLSEYLKNKETFK